MGIKENPSQHDEFVGIGFESLDIELVSKCTTLINLTSFITELAVSKECSHNLTFSVLKKIDHFRIPEFIV